jgi:hypothetical protein
MPHRQALSSLRDSMPNPAGEPSDESLGYLRAPLPGHGIVSVNSRPWKDALALVGGFGPVTKARVEVPFPADVLLRL